jgi:hypothetical protein
LNSLDPNCITAPIQAARIFSTPTFHGWARLPPELKLRVLGYRLSCPNPIDAKTHSQNIVEVLLPLMSKTEVGSAGLIWEACKHQFTPLSGHI